MAAGTITRKDLITDEALDYGIELSKNINSAIDATKNLKDASKEFNKVAQSFRSSKTEKEFVESKKRQSAVTKLAVDEQIKLEKANQAAIQTTIKLNEQASKKKVQSEKAKQAAIKTTSDLDKRAAQNAENEQKIARSLLQTRRSEIQLSESQRRQKEAIARSSEREQRATERLNSAFAKLNARRTAARKRVEDLNAQKVLGNRLSDKEQRELKQTTKEFQRLEKQIRKIDQANGKFQANVGNYPKLFGSARSALVGFIGAFGLFQGVSFFADFTRDSFRLAQEAKGIEFAFERIGSNATKAFDDVRKSTRGLISDLDIKRSIVEFDNFNLSLEESGTLFEFLALRSTQTGRSIDTLRDSLVEGLSKESKLRIDNLGISMTELNAELEKAPSFIEAVSNIAKREVAEAGNVLDEAANSQDKWNANLENTSLAFGNLITQITSGQGRVSIFLNDTLKGFEILFNTINQFVKSEQEIIDQGATVRAKRNIESISNAAEVLGKSFDEAVEIDLSSKQAQLEIEAVNEKLKQARTQLQEFKEESKSQRLFTFFSRLFKTSGTEIERTVEALEIEKKTLEESIKLTDELIKKEKGRTLESTSASPSSDEKIGVDKQKKIQEKALLELNKFRREQEIKRINDQLKVDELSLEKRLNLIAEKTKKEIELEQFLLLETVRIEELKGSQRVLAEKETQAQIQKIRQDSLVNALIQTKQFEEEQKRIDDQRILSIRQRLEESGVTDPSAIASAEKEIEEIKIKSSQTVFERQVDFLEGLLKVEGITAEQRKAIDDEITNLKLENLKIVTERVKEENKKQEDDLKAQQERVRDLVVQSAENISNSLNISSGNIITIFDGLSNKLEEGENKFERFAEVAAASFDLIGEVSNNVFEARIESIDREIAANEENFARQLELAQGNKVQTDLLEKERETKKAQLEKKKRKEQEKQAKFNKALAAVDIIVNTGIAIIKSVAASPLTGGQPFAAIAAALGAAQLAAVLATPIPKFKKGVKDFDGGPAILGDGGVPEVITNKDGGILGVSPAKDTLYNLPKGANVYSSTDEFAKQNGLMDDLLGKSILSSVKNDGKKIGSDGFLFNFNKNFDNLGKEMIGGVKQGLRGVRYTVVNNVNVDASHSEYVKSGLS